MINYLRQQLGRIFARTAPAGASAEGAPREGPWAVFNPDGWLPHAWGKYWNYWQMDYDPISGGSTAVVEACVNAYSQTIAMCPGDHWRTDPVSGNHERVTTSALSRILRRPNPYQTRSDFVLNLARNLYSNGNSYALAERNDRFEVSALHPFDPSQSRALIANDGSIFYELGGNDLMERQFAEINRRLGLPPGIVMPARDVLHVKLEAKPDEPLVGIAPIRHAEAAIAAQNIISSQLINFFGNMSRPSGILSTDATLNTEQMKMLRERWNEQAKGLNAGGVPILSNGLKFAPMSVNAKDADLSGVMRFTQDEIFMVYGVPPAILGMTDKGTFSSTEALMQFWLARGLGFAINHIEVALDHFFGLKGWPDEYVEFDTSALLRQAFKDRIDALARGVQGGIFAPNEARAIEGYGKAVDGDEPRVQQQVVPLSAWSQAPPQTPAPGAPEAPEPAPGPAANGDGKEQEASPEERRMVALGHARRYLADARRRHAAA